MLLVINAASDYLQVLVLSLLFNTLTAIDLRSILQT